MWAILFGRQDELLIMNDKPDYPIILTDDTTGNLELVENSDHYILTTTTVLGLFKASHKRFKAYDKDGYVWKIDNVESNYKINRLSKFLAYTIYNPQLKISLRWTKIREYQIDELKTDIYNQVDKDDDIITQWEEADFIKQRIETCKSFDAIVETLNRYVFKVDEEQLWKEQESRR